MKDYQKIFDDLLLIVRRESASDLHLSSGRRPILRVHGELTPLLYKNVLSAEDTFGIAKLVLRQDELETILKKKEIDFSVSAPGDMRLRGTAFIRARSVQMNFRIIEPVRSMAELNLPQDALGRVVSAKQGLFLVAGPVGHGKSTAMASIVDAINESRREHIVTIENPIEHVFTDKNSMIDQREVGRDTLSFSSGLKATLRQDVNVIMVGEMRHRDTITTGVTAAETGHLVFSTLHTNSAAQTIDRIIDVFPPEQQSQIRVQLSTSLLGVLSLRLISSARGGLIPAYELMFNNKAISHMIRENRAHEINTVLETSLEEGMVTLNRSLVDLVQRGHITIDEAFKYSQNPNALKTLLR